MFHFCLTLIANPYHLEKIKAEVQELMITRLILPTAYFIAFFRNRRSVSTQGILNCNSDMISLKTKQLILSKVRGQLQSSCSTLIIADIANSNSIFLT